MRASPGDMRTNDVSRVLPTEQASVRRVHSYCNPWV